MPLQVVRTGHKDHGSIVERPNLVRVRVMNSGKQPIHGHEMDPHLRFELKESDFVVGIIARQSGDVSVTLTGTDDTKVLSVDLNFLNPDEWFEAQLSQAARLKRREWQDA